MLKTTNNATGLLALPITDVETTLALQTGQGARFPTLAAGEYFPLTVVRAEDPTQFEIMRVTDRSGDTLTVTREQEGTTAITFSAGDIVELRLTSGAIQESFPQVVGSDAGSKGVEFDVAGVTAGQKRTVTVPDTDVTLGQVASTGITDSTEAGRTLLTAADATAQKTALALENVNNTADADKPISTATQTALDAKQATLVSGTNLKTVGGQSLLGSGDVSVSVPDGTTSVKGIVQLSTSVSSTSTTLASTPSAVKQAYDLAAAALSKDMGHNEVGSLCFARRTVSGVLAPGATIAGSDLRAACITGTSSAAVETSGTSLTGTWRQLGGYGGTSQNATLFQRIA